MQLSARLSIGLTLVGFGALALNSCGGRKLTQRTGAIHASADRDPHPGPLRGARALLQLRQAAHGQRDGGVQDRRAGLPGRRGRGDPHAAGGAAPDLPGRHGPQPLARSMSGSSRSSTARGFVPPPRARAGRREEVPYDEQFDRALGEERARFGPVSYRATCSPSAVPIPPGLPPQQAGCPLAPSREVACGQEPEGKYYGDVEAALSQVLKEKPELFDFTDINPGSDFPAIKDLNAYNKAVVDAMTAKGYCAKHDGEELALKKGSNTFSEQYDVDIAERYIRRGGGIYRVSCYPAAF